MIKFNRIGNKLGLAGLFGILLSGGMVANQLISEAAVNSANQRADVQQKITDHALEGDVALRRMQLSVRDIRVSRSPAEVEKGVSGLKEAHEVAIKELDIAIGRSLRPENKERLQKIGALAAQYYFSAAELAKTQLKIFGIEERRNKLNAGWVKEFEAELASPALIGAVNRPELEKILYEADSRFKRAARSDLAV